MMTIRYQIFDGQVDREVYKTTEDFWNDLKFLVSIGAYIQ